MRSSCTSKQGTFHALTGMGGNLAYNPVTGLCTPPDLVSTKLGAIKLV